MCKPRFPNQIRQKERHLKRQFSIGYGDSPTVMHFNKGRFYKYHGEKYDLESLVHFALEAWPESTH